MLRADAKTSNLLLIRSGMRNFCIGGCESLRFERDWIERSTIRKLPGNGWSVWVRTESNPKVTHSDGRFPPHDFTVSFERSQYIVYCDEQDQLDVKYLLEYDASGRIRSTYEGDGRKSSITGFPTEQNIYSFLCDHTLVYAPNTPFP